jgi:UDP-perosamine 4-acetyltransferase
MNVPLHPSVVVIGASGHAKVIFELIRAAGEYTIVGCTDVAGKASNILGVTVLGTDEILPALHRQGTSHAFIAIGDNAARQDVGQRVIDLGFQLANAISPQAILSPSIHFGRGIAVMTGAILNAEASVGDLAIINTGAVVDHDCKIGRGAHIGPGARLAGNVTVGTGAFVGAGATIVPGIQIGDGATVGAGAVVIRDVPPRAVVVGVPARAV